MVWPNKKCSWPRQGLDRVIFEGPIRCLDALSHCRTWLPRHGRLSGSPIQGRQRFTARGERVEQSPCPRSQEGTASLRSPGSLWPERGGGRQGQAGSPERSEVRCRGRRLTLRPGSAGPGRLPVPSPSLPAAAGDKGDTARGQMLGTARGHSHRPELQGTAGSPGTRHLVRWQLQ